MVLPARYYLQVDPWSIIQPMTKVSYSRSISFSLLDKILISIPEANIHRIPGKAKVILQGLQQQIQIQLMLGKEVCCESLPSKLRHLTTNAQSKSQVMPSHPDLQGVALGTCFNTAPVHLGLSFCSYPFLFLKSLPPDFPGYTALPQKPASPTSFLGSIFKDFQGLW